MLRFVRSWSAISRSLPQFAPARRHQSRRRFTLERLEGRSLLSTVHLTVNTLADDPGCSVAGQTTLRDAITAADAGSTANKYVIKFAVDGTISLTAPLPALTGNIAIKGPGATNLLILSGNPTFASSVFNVSSNATAAVSGLTIEGINEYDQSAGGINNDGYLTCRNDAFTNCSGELGGGIYNETGATAIISGTVFSGDLSEDCRRRHLQFWNLDRSRLCFQY